MPISKAQRPKLKWRRRRPEDPYTGRRKKVNAHTPWHVLIAGFEFGFRSSAPEGEFRGWGEYTREHDLAPSYAHKHQVALAMERKILGAVKTIAKHFGMKLVPIDGPSDDRAPLRFGPVGSLKNYIEHPLPFPSTKQPVNTAPTNPTSQHPAEPHR